MRIQESQRMALPRWSKALSYTSINFVIGQVPDNQLRGETKRVAGKVVPRQDSGTGGGGGKIVRLTQNYGLRTNFKKHVASLWIRQPLKTFAKPRG